MLSPIGLVFFGSLVVPLSALEQASAGLMLVGLVLSLAFWAVSLYVMTYVNTSGSYHTHPFIPRPSEYPRGLRMLQPP
jgi:hypothetical protein